MNCLRTVNKSYYGLRILILFVTNLKQAQTTIARKRQRTLQMNKNLQNQARRKSMLNKYSSKLLISLC